MSTSSSRLVKWFGTRVAMISRGVLAIFVALVALPLSGIIYVFFGYSSLYTLQLGPFLLILSIGTLLYFVFLLILSVLYKNPPTNPSFHELIGRVHQKILVPSNAQVWIRQSKDPFITSTFNPVFSAVIVSEPMTELMLNRSEAGEVLLAFHLARMPRKPWFGDYVGSLVLLLVLTYTSGLILVPVVISMLSMIDVLGLYIIASLFSSLLYNFFFPFFLALIIKGAFWRHEPAFLRVTDVYGMHPQVAKVEVERGSPLNEEEMQTVIWGVREWEKKRRASRRLGVGTIVTIPIGIILFFLTVGFGYFPYYNMFLIYAPFAVAILIGMVVYFVMRRWDKNAMGDVFKETTDSHEPVWMD
ncbi:MAG: hypothetical protein ACFFE6_11690 [Candidatus Thorarchaeota archaeon]